MGVNRMSKVPSVSEEAAATIRRLRQRLYVVEPVYRAAMALHRVGARRTPEAVECVERAVARAIDIERMIAEGWSISISDLDLEREVL